MYPTAPANKQKKMRDTKTTTIDVETADNTEVLVVLQWNYNKEERAIMRRPCETSRVKMKRCDTFGQVFDRFLERYENSFVCLFIREHELIWKHLYYRFTIEPSDSPQSLNLMQEEELILVGTTNEEDADESGNDVNDADDADEDKETTDSGTTEDGERSQQTTSGNAAEAQFDFSKWKPDWQNQSGETMYMGYPVKGTNEHKKTSLTSRMVASIMDLQESREGPRISDPDACKKTFVDNYLVNVIKEKLITNDSSEVDIGRLVRDYEKRKEAEVPYFLGLPQGTPCNKFAFAYEACLVQHSLRADPNLKPFLEEWASYCGKWACTDCPVQASRMYFQGLQGMARASLDEIYFHYTLPEGTVYDLERPKRMEGHLVAYTVPGVDFKVMGNEILYIMKNVLAGCGHQDIEPIRLKWIYLLLKELGYDDAENINLDMHCHLMFALATCLVLAGTTSDYICIKGTSKLNKAGLLSIEKMAAADPREIEEIVGDGGIGAKRSRFLKSMAMKFLYEHGGRVPSDLRSLTAIEGIGRKTAILLLNEGYGLFAGIGSDVHVCEGSIALGLHLHPQEKLTVNPMQVEMSLRKWVKRSDYTGVNGVIGGMVQLVTQDLRVVGNQKRHNCKKLMDVIGTCLHKPKHMEMIWFTISRLRVYYATYEKKRQMQREINRRSRLQKKIEGKQDKKQERKTERKVRKRKASEMDS